MAFTRKFLKALGIEEDKIDTIIEEHTTVTEALKKERDGFKADADKLPGIQKQLEEAQNAGKNKDGKDYKQLYTDLVQANEKAQSRAGKEAGFKGALKAAGISEKFWPLIIKASGSTIDKLEMDGEKVKDCDTIVASLKTDYADYVSEEHEEGADPGNPHHDSGGKKELGEMSMEDYIAARTKK